jgi:hypothetical protein
MQLLLPRQMAASTVTICDLCDLFPKFSMPHPLARVARCANANQVPLSVYPLLHGCIYGTRKQRSPSCVHRRGYAESHGQSMLQVLHSKHNDHHREQKLHAVTVALNDDMEFEQILLNAQLQAMKLGHQQNVGFRQSLQPSQLGDSRQGSARDDL